MFVPKEVETRLAPLLVTLLQVNKDRKQCREGLFWVTVGDRYVMVGKVWQLELEALQSGRKGNTGSGADL